MGTFSGNKNDIRSREFDKFDKVLGRGWTGGGGVSRIGEYSLINFEYFPLTLSDLP